MKLTWTHDGRSYVARPENDPDGRVVAYIDPLVPLVDGKFAYEAIWGPGGGYGRVVGLADTVAEAQRLLDRYAADVPTDADDAQRRASDLLHGLRALHAWAVTHGDNGPLYAAEQKLRDASTAVTEAITDLIQVANLDSLKETT